MNRNQKILRAFFNRLHAYSYGIATTRGDDEYLNKMKFYAARALKRGDIIKANELMFHCLWYVGAPVCENAI